MQTTTTMVNGIPMTRSNARADGIIQLSKQDAEDLKNFIQNKGAVQTVQMTPLQS